MFQEEYNREFKYSASDITPEPWTGPGCGGYYGMDKYPSLNTHVADKSASSIETDIPNRGLVNHLTGQIVEIINGQVMAKLTIKTR